MLLKKFIEYSAFPVRPLKVKQCADHLIQSLRRLDHRAADCFKFLVVPEYAADRINAEENGG